MNNRVQLSEVGEGWTNLKRKSIRTRGKLLRFLESYVRGKYAVGPRFISFENEQEALVYRIKYPR